MGNPPERAEPLTRAPDPTADVPEVDQEVTDASRIDREVADVPEVDLTEPTGAVLAEQAIRVAVGSLAIGIAALGEAVRRTLPTSAPSDEPSAGRPDPLGVSVGALLGITLVVGDRLATAAGAVVRSVGPPAAWAAAVTPLPGMAGKIRSAAEDLDGRWRSSRPEAEAVAATFARELVPEILDAVLDQIDLTWLVAERVDLDELIARVDLDAVVSRVDVDRVVSRLDLDEIASRIDLDAIVSRVDVDQVAKRLDLDAVIARIDLPELARSVIEEIDLPEIIRESSGTMASETVRGVRIQGIEADAAVSRAVDRILLRRRGRDTDAPGDPESFGTPLADDDPQT
jgi:hypothetical protein